MGQIENILEKAIEVVKEDSEKILSLGEVNVFNNYANEILAHLLKKNNIDFCIMDLKKMYNMNADPLFLVKNEDVFYIVNFKCDLYNRKLAGGSFINEVGFSYLKNDPITSGVFYNLINKCYSQINTQQLSKYLEIFSNEYIMPNDINFLFEQGKFYGEKVV